MRLSFINSYFAYKNSENNVIIGVSCETNVKLLLILSILTYCQIFFTNTTGYIRRILFFSLILMLLNGF